MEHINYENIITLMGDEAAEAIAVLEKDGVTACIAHLQKWQQPGEGTIVSTPGDPWRPEHSVFKEGDFVVFHNPSKTSISLVAKIDWNV